MLKRIPYHQRKHMNRINRYNDIVRNVMIDKIDNNVQCITHQNITGVIYRTLYRSITGDVVSICIKIGSSIKRNE